MSSQSSASKVVKSPTSQQQLKRQREWVYLAHFLALAQLHPLKTISGQDDGQEPDFTCVFAKQSGGEYHIGIELTTLPRLRDRLGNDNLMLKRWYWQSRLQFYSRFHPTTLAAKHLTWQAQINNTPLGLWANTACVLATSAQPLAQHSRHTWGNRVQQTVAHTMRFLPRAFLEDMADSRGVPIDSLICQRDIDAVMAKKASKVDAYQSRRKLDAVWLLIHTNEQQENGVLAADVSTPLWHDSDFARVFVTLYPNVELLEVSRCPAVIIQTPMPSRHTAQARV